MDTANKRMSAINVGSPWRGLLPIPDGVISQGDRQHAALMYAGILATAVVAATIPTYDPNTRSRPGYAPFTFPPKRFPPNYVKTR